MKQPLKLGFYGILTSPRVGYEQLAEVMVEAGLRIIQLRMKDVPSDEMEAMGRKLRAIIPPEVIFIVNDNPYVAMAVGADGVHLGQGDMGYQAARQLLGPSAIIGLSTHNPAQTEEACAVGPDYIGVGPVFATPTKKVPDPVIGVAGMKAQLAVATVPAVCLGGIDHENVRSVLSAGASSVCAVRCINQSTDPAAELAKMKQVMGTLW